MKIACGQPFRFHFRVFSWVSWPKPPWPLSVSFRVLPWPKIRTAYRDKLGRKLPSRCVALRVTHPTRDTDRSLDKRRDGAVVWVAPQPELAKFEQDKEDARIAIENREDLVTDYVQINYHSASAIFKALTEAKGVGNSGGGGGTGNNQNENGFLSQRGRLVADERTNTLMISDIPKKIAQMRELIAVIDRPVDQVIIEGRIVIATDTPLGAEVAAQTVAEAVSRQKLLQAEPQAYVTDAGSSAPYKGDLTNFLPLDPLFSELLPAPDNLQKRTTRPAAGNADSGDALFADSQIPVALVGTSYSANPHWNFLGALQQALRSDVVNYAEDGHGPLLPMLKYLQTDAFKTSAPQVLVWEFPERYLPMKNDLSAFDPQWIAQLKQTRTANQDMALSSNRTQH